MCPPLLSLLIPDNYRLSKNNCLVLLPLPQKRIVANCAVFTHFLHNSGNLPCLYIEQAQPPQPLQIQMKCLQGLKNKGPRGSRLLTHSVPAWSTGRLCLALVANGTAEDQNTSIEARWKLLWHGALFPWKPLCGSLSFAHITFHSASLLSFSYLSIWL